MLSQGASGFAVGSLPLAATELEGLGGTAVQPISSFPLNGARSGSGNRYPGARPRGSFVVRQGVVHPLHFTASGWQVLVSGDDGQSEFAHLDDWLVRNREVPLSARLASVGYGSNVNPGEVEKFSGGRATVVLAACTVGLRAAHLRRPRSSDGQFPAGLVRADANHVEMHGVVLIDPVNAGLLDGKEGQGSAYVRSAISSATGLGAVLEDGTQVDEPLPTYLQHEKRLAALGGQPIALAEVEQSAFAALVDRASELSASGLTSEPIDELPPLSVRPVPYFVYGTLRPGESRWHPIADMVERTSEARIRGSRFDTGYGYPGLLLSGEGFVDGVLLHPRADRRFELRTTLDAIEGHPRLYIRTLVRLADGTIAWTYVWNGTIR